MIPAPVKIVCGVALQHVVRVAVIAIQIPIEVLYRCLFCLKIVQVLFPYAMSVNSILCL